MEKRRLRWILGAVVVGLGGGCELIAGLGDPVLDNMALCSDGIQDGNETSKDCGGCTANCSDGAKNGNETGVDCGGGSCLPCANGRGCAVGGDCLTGVCEAGSCKDFYVWAKRFGPLEMMSSSGVSHVAVDSVGDVLLAGSFQTNFSLGPGTQLLTATEGIFAAKLSPSGALLWSEGAKGTLPAHVSSVVVDGANNLVMVGAFLGTLTLGATQHTSAGYSDILVAKTYAGTGAFNWSARFGGSDVEQGWGVAVDGAGDIILTGFFHSSTINFGGGALSGANGQTYLVKLNAAGAHVWSKNFNAGDGAQVAIDGTGNIILNGAFWGTANFGSGPLTSMGGADVFVAKFDASGACLWSKRFGDAQDQYVDRIAVDKGGSILVAGRFTGTLDWGSGKLTSPGSAAFLVKLDPSGNYVWGRSFDQANGSIFVNQIAVDSAGNVAMAGQLGGMVDLGGGLLVSAGNNDVFVVKLDVDGKYVWGRRFGDGQQQSGASLAFYDAKGLVIAGRFMGTIDLGGGPLVSMSVQDVFLAKLLTP